MPSTKPLLAKATYDYLKQAVEIVLPAVGTLYFTLAQIWNLPYGEQVVGTIVALALFGGVLIGVSKKSYNNSDEKFDGALLVDDLDPDQTHKLEFKQTLEDLGNQDTVTLKVDRLSH